MYLIGKMTVCGAKKLELALLGVNEKPVMRWDPASH